MSIEAAEAVTSPTAMESADWNDPSAPAADAPPSRSLLRQAVVDTISSRLARAGLIWLVLLALMAVFAPFVANTHPVAMKVAGRWSSPLLKNLTPADVTLLIDTAVIVILAVTRPFTFAQALGAVLWFTALAVPLTLWPGLVAGNYPDVSAGSLAFGILAPLLLAGCVVAAWASGPSSSRALTATLRSHGVATIVSAALGVAGLIVVGWIVQRSFAGFGIRLHLMDALLGLDFWAVLLLPLAVRPATRAALAAGAGASVLIVLLIALPVRPPENVDYSQYRERAAEGKIQSAHYTLIPFSPRDRLRDQPYVRLAAPSHDHWLGTDTNGADLLSELIHASRIALSIGFIATGISVVIGVIVGGIMGFYAGALDLLGMRFIEIFEAIPRLFLLITVTAFVRHRDIYLMMAVIGATGWTGYARFLRAEFFTLRKLDFVHAATAAGLPLRSIVFRHMLPNGMTPILVSTTFGVASAILYESVLSFLGLGLVDEASWGALLNQARAGGTGFIWWIATFPGLMIFLTVFAYNLVGESVRDALDPRLRKRD